MQTLTLKSHAGSYGMLHLEVPVIQTDTDFRVTVILQPVIPVSKPKTPEDLGWTPGFFENTYGAWEGELRREQPYEQRKEWP